MEKQGQHQIDASHSSVASMLSLPILTLPNKNITIRPFQHRDAPSLSKHMNNIAVWNNLRNRAPFPYLETDAHNWVNIATDPATFIASGPCNPESSPEELSDPSKKPSTEIIASGPKSPTHFAIVLNNDEAIGAIGLDFGNPSEVYARSAEIGYWLGEAHWGKGIMSAVVKAFVPWAWSTFGVLVRLNAELNAENVASLKALEGAGFAVEGRRRKAVVKRGVLRDIVYLGMLRPEGAEGEGAS